MSIPSQPGPPDLERITPTDSRILMFDVHLNAVYCHVWTRVGGDRKLVDRIVQETFLAAIDRWATRKRPMMVLVWLCAIADELVVEYFLQEVSNG